MKGYLPKSKKELAKQLGISRQSLYYQPKLPAKDLKLKAEIEKVENSHRFKVSTGYLC